MPPVAAYIASYAAAQLFASVLAKIIVSAVISFAINAVFSKKPSSGPGFERDAQDRSLTVRQPISATRVIYGRQLVGGVFDFIHTSSRSFDVLALGTAQDVVGSTLTVRVDTSAWRRSIRVTTRVYDADAGGYEESELTEVASAPADGQYSVSGGVYTFNAAQEGARVAITYEYVGGTTVNHYLHLVIEWAGHEVDAIEEIWFDDAAITIGGDGYATGRYAGGYVYVSNHLGADDQTADESLVSFCPDKWTTNHRLRGQAYSYIRLQRNPELFPQGLPNIRAKIRGKKVYDPRSATTAWSDNAALCVADYLLNARYGLGHVYADEVDETTLTAAANVCDEDVALAAGGTENRYTCNGSFLTSERPVDVLGRLKVAMAGEIVRVGGKWKIHAGAYRAPTVSLSEDDARGPLQVKARLSGRELFNGVKGVYVSPDNGWQPADFPAVTNATYLAEDDDERSWLDIDLAFTDSPSMAQRIAKIELERVRQQITVIMPCKLSAYQAEPPDTIELTDSVFGWTDKVFETKEAQLVVDRDEAGNPAIGVDLLLRETASSVYDWSSGEETQVDTAPDTDLPNPFAVAPPGQPDVTEELYETLGGAGVRAMAIVTWAAAADGQAARYEFELRDTAGTLLRQVNGIDAVNRRLEVLDVAPATYLFRVRAVNGLGVRSAWAQTEREVVGLAAEPEDISGFTLQAAGGLAILRWTLHPDLDVRIGGKIVFRHSEATSGAVWQEAFTIGAAAPGNANFAVLPLKAGTYLARAEDSSGILSVNTATIPTKQASVLAFSTLNTVQEDTTFTGTHSGTVAIDSVLKLTSASNFDDIADFDSVASLDDIGGAGSSGTYSFATGIDLTTVKRVRVTSKLEGVIVNVNDLIDSRENAIDDWLDFDGTQGADADAYVEMRETDDDPAGTPTWSDWKRVDADEHECRGLEFRARLVSNDPAYNVHIDVLRATVAEVV